MTKSEVKKLGVEDLRELLDEHLDGITGDMTKDDLKVIVDDNWDFLNATLNPPSTDGEPNAGEETEEEAEAEGETDEEEEEVPSKVAELLSKDLYTNQPDPRLLAGAEE